MNDAPPRPRSASPSDSAEPSSADVSRHVLSRTAYADQLAGHWLASRRGEEPGLRLRAGEAAVIVRLLGEVDRTYRGEPLGQLAHRIGEILSKRAGL